MEKFPWANQTLGSTYRTSSHRLTQYYYNYISFRTLKLLLLTIVSFSLFGKLSLVDLVLPVGHAGGVSDLAGGGSDHKSQCHSYHSQSRSYSKMVPHP